MPLWYVGVIILALALWAEALARPASLRWVVALGILWPVVFFVGFFAYRNSVYPYWSYNPLRDAALFIWAVVGWPIISCLWRKDLLAERERRAAKLGSADGEARPKD